MPAARGLLNHRVVFLFLHWKVIFKPHSNHFKGWKDNFVRMRGRDNSSSVTIGEVGVHRFPLTLTDDPIRSMGINTLALLIKRLR